MDMEKKRGKKKLDSSNQNDQANLKKHIDKNETQQKVLEKMAQILKEKK